MAQWRDQRGVSTLSEYAVTVFLVVVTISAMSLYVQRTFQGRVHDARHYMVKNINDGCDLYCGEAAGLSKWLINVSDDSINSQCDNLNNMECAKEQAFIYQQKMPEQYEPYYAQVKSDVAADSDHSKGLYASNNKSGTFFSRDNSQSQSATISNTAAPKKSWSRHDVWLVSSED